MAFGVKVLADFAKNGRIKRAWGASYSLNIRALPHTKQNLPSCSFFVRWNERTEFVTQRFVR